MKWISCLLFFIAFMDTAAAQVPKGAVNSCKDLQQVLQSQGLTLRYQIVPEDYSQPNGLTLNIAYWVRPAKTSVTAFPPLLLIHGGPVSSSNRFLAWSPVIRDYPGDVIGVEERGEGCSSFQSSGLGIGQYNLLRARHIVRDFEQLRIALYGASTPWRVFGQSRGSVIGHYYLEMFPDSIESLHLHGFSMGTRQSMQEYSAKRSFFSARASRVFVSQYPAAGIVLKKLKQWVDDIHFVREFLSIWIPSPLTLFAGVS